ncbi:MAG: Dihydrofolate reductase [Nevskia sp.]|nr:Dihydrofolate reductase [Nevskia sp.]
MPVDPRLVLIAAVADNGTIGRGGGLPWRLPDDLKRFRQLTLGNTILMGRKTYDSLGKPLDGRRNWVLTRDAGFAPLAGVEVFSDLTQALAAPAGGELLVIGGAQLYQQTLPLAARLELTRVHAAVEGDTFFPAIDPRDWQETAREEHAADARHAYDYAFVTLQRR